MNTQDTNSSRDEEIPTLLDPQHVADEVRLYTNKSIRENAAYTIEELNKQLIRLSAERERERPVANRDVPTLFPTLQHEIESLRSNLAERDNQLAEVVAQCDKRQEHSLALLREAQDLRAQLLAAQTVNGKMREAFGPHEDPKLTRLGWVETLVRSIKKDPKVAELLSPYDSDALWECLGECEALVRDGQAALALSPDPTLLDEVDDEDVKAAVALIVEAESECHAYNPSVTRISTRLHKALFRLRQSTRETEREGL